MANVREKFMVFVAGVVLLAFGAGIFEAARYTQIWEGV